MKKQLDVAQAGNDQAKSKGGSTPERMNAKDEWAVVQKVRLPHKVGLPLGSGGGGDDGS